MPNLNIYITLDSYYRAVLVAIVIIKQTSRTGIMEYFLDILREGYIVFYNVLQGNYTIIKAMDSRIYINVEVYI